jgi:predicted ATPase/DNA-binding SARP family transcriptional activator
MMNRLQIHLFGAFQVIRNHSAITQFEATTARGLLAYLVMHTHAPQPREQLAHLLWASDSGASALTSLRSGLRRVREALDEGGATQTPLLLVERDTVQFDPKAACWVDVHVFEDLIAQVSAHPHRRLERCPWCMARLAEAVALYRGPFLAHLRIDSLAFEEWQRVQQERLHRLAMQALYILTDYHFRRGEYATAEAYARRQLALEQWNEEAHSQLIRILYAAGQRSAALAQYAACRAILDAELGVPPMAETTALYDQIRQANGRSGPAPIPLPAHNLPRIEDSFVGREQELAWLSKRLSEPAHRLTTLVGAGGAGKSRLARQAASALIGAFADGVWWVALAELSPTDDAALAQESIATHLARALGFALAGQERPTQQVLAYLRTKELLLIFDNVEHLPAAVDFLRTLLRQCPEVTLLVTARAALDLQSETILRIDSLPVPQKASDPAVLTYPAVQLFLTRANQRGLSTELSKSELAAVVMICQWMQGMPLGIEMAANLAHQLAPTAIVQRLRSTWKQIGTQWSSQEKGQHSLRAMFESLWVMLSVAAQQLLGQVALFRGGFTREALLAITGATAETMAILTEQALIQHSEPDRYTVHELMREFAEEKWAQSSQMTINLRFCRYYLALLHEASDALELTDTQHQLQAVQREWENIRQAWRWAISDNQFELLSLSVVPLAELSRFWGHTVEGKVLLNEALAQVRLCGTDAPTEIRLMAQLLIELAQMQTLLGEVEAASASAQQALTLAQELDAADLQVQSYIAWGTAVYHRGEYSRVQALMERATTLAQGLADPRLLVRVLLLLDYPVTHTSTYLEQALALAETLSAPQIYARVLGSIACAAMYRGQYQLAGRYWLDALQRVQVTGNVVQEGSLCNNLGEVFRQTGDYAQAQRYFARALAICQERGMRPVCARIHEGLGRLYAEMGDCEQALSHIRTGLELSQEQGLVDTQAYLLNSLGNIQRMRCQYTLARSAYREAERHGQVVGWPGLHLESKVGLAMVALAQGHHDDARALVPEILRLIQDNELSCAESMPAYWGCYQILAAADDPRSVAVLERAYQRLQEQGALLEEPTVQAAFFNQIRVNREICAERERRLATTERATQNRLSMAMTLPALADNAAFSMISTACSA